MFRLYVGLVRQGKWFNHTKVNPLKGLTISMLDTPDQSGAGRVLSFVKGCINTLYTESGEEYKLTDEDYELIKMADTWKIIREANKVYSGNDYPVFDEYFYCKTCSSLKNERYTKVSESWDELVEKGIIDEIYLESPEEMTYETILPIPIQIEGNKIFTGGSYDTLIREHLSIKQVIQISKSAFAQASEANMLYAIWDAQIKSVKGLNEREFNILKRNKEESFSKKYIIDQDNIDELTISEKLLGLDAKYRQVTCKHCQSEIGGSLDFTNFFSFLQTKKLNHSAKTGTPKM